MESENKKKSLIRISGIDGAFKDNLGIAQKNLSELLDDGIKLRDTILEESEDFEFVDDYIQLSRIVEKLYALKDILWSVGYFWFPYVFCKSRAADAEENKVAGEMSFEVTKNFRTTVKSVLLSCVESLLNISKQWKFDDYRSRNFQDDLRDEMKEMREMIEEFLDNE